MNETLPFTTLILLGMLAFATGAFVVGAMLWLRRLRRTLSDAVSEALQRQIHHGQKVEEALALLQHEQKQVEKHIMALAQAHNRLRNDVTTVAQRVEQHQREVAGDAQPPQSRLLH